MESGQKALIGKFVLNYFESMIQEILFKDFLSFLLAFVAILQSGAEQLVQFFMRGSRKFLRGGPTCF